MALLGQGFRKPHILGTFCSKNTTSTWRIFTKLYSPVYIIKALLHVEQHCSSPSGTYPGANPRSISANPSWPSNSKTAQSISFKLTVPSCFLANLMHVKRHLSISIISDTFPSRFCPKSANFRGVGSLKQLNLRNCAVHLNAVSDLDSQDAGLSKSGHVFELQSAVQEP